MKLRIVLPALWCAAVAGLPAAAHGPQIQITNDQSKIVTRALHLDGPYSDALTDPKSVYVMSILPHDGVWYARPNSARDAILNTLEFPSGPGLAYGYDLVDGGPQAFAATSVISAGFTAGLKLWDGAAFVDAGITQLKAFRGSNPTITQPDESLAVTSDGPAFDSLSLNPVATDYGNEGAEVHGGFRWALLGDGSSPTSPSPDGVYLVSLSIASTQDGLSPSDEFYFVLNKNAPWPTVASAVASLEAAPLRQQWVAPEPTTGALLAIGLAAFAISRRQSRQRQGQ